MPLAPRSMRWALAVACVLAAVAALLLVHESPAGPTGRWLRDGGLESRYATIDGVKVRYVRAGSGPPLVLLHGFGSAIYTWSEVFQPLAREHDVVAIDLPGFGASDQPADLSFELYPRVVVGLMDELGLTRASLVGSSMGGAAALLVAARHPERVDKLVLIDSAGFNLDPADRPLVVRLVGSSVAPLLGRLPIRRILTRAALRQVFFDPAMITAEREEEYVAPMLRPGAATAIRSLMASRGGDKAAMAATLSRVNAPTLVLWGADDRWIPAAQADLFVAALPGSRKKLLAACGHLPQEERPAETIEAIRSFLAPSV